MKIDLSAGTAIVENGADARCATMSYIMEVVDDYANHTS
jgi:hypothetical protein